jgi:hypothetical protein
MRYLIPLAMLFALFLTGASPIQAQPPGVCEAAYGQTPAAPQPNWLRRDPAVTDLATQNRYDLLSAHLLKSGLVDGASCPAGGLNADGSPNGCGLALAQEPANAWQNRYDAAILSAASTKNLPPYAVKSVIAVESQFWPAPDWTRGEIGLGQMTAGGADLALTYRPEFYQEICRQALGEETCQRSYIELPPSSKYMLQGLVLRSIDATCPNCQGGIDPARGDQAVEVLSETLSASCVQGARVFKMGTGKKPAELLSYEDFWRFVLADYHSGAGCLYQALRLTGYPTSWSAISTNLAGYCTSGREYVRRIEENLKP